MKTFKTLYPTICSFENLELAFRKARRGKRSKANVAAFEGDLDLELLDLQDALTAGRRWWVQSPSRRRSGAWRRSGQGR